MADMFGRDPVQLKTPMTADKCDITWENENVASAIQFSIEYGQQVTRRRSIGSQDAIIYGSQPQGRATMARLITSDGTITTGPSWSCKTGTLKFYMSGCEGAGGGVFIANGCIVTSYNISAQAEDLTVMDNVTIEFMELEKLG